MKSTILTTLLLVCSWTAARADEPALLSRAGGASAMAVTRAEGLAGAMRLSAQCMNEVQSGQQSAHYCLGLESVSMVLFRKTAPATLDATTLDWFDGEAMTSRVLTYCYTHLALKGDMQCLAQMGVVKAAIAPLLSEQNSAARQ